MGIVMGYQRTLTSCSCRAYDERKVSQSDLEVA